VLVGEVGGTEDEDASKRPRALPRTPWTRWPTPSLATTGTGGGPRHARANSTELGEVTMLTILLIIVVVLLMTGGVGYRRRGRRRV
jgi:hypothetical protein